MSSPSARALPALILCCGLLSMTQASGVTGAAPPVPTPPTGAASGAAPTVRDELVKPLQAAQELIAARKGADALAKLKEAEAHAPLTPYETYLVTRLRGQAELANNDLANGARDLAATLASDQLPAADRLPFTKALAQIYYQDQKYADAATWIQRYFAAGGEDPLLRRLLPQAQYAAKDYVPAAKGFQAEVAALEAAGKPVPEKTLRLLASAQSNAHDDAGYDATLDRLAAAYGKGEHGRDYVAHVMNQALPDEQLPDRLFLDYYRLKTLAFGKVSDGDRLSYAEMALRAGFPAEAQRLLDAGLAAKTFTGPAAAKAAKLRDSAARAAAQDQSQAAADEAAARQAHDGTALVALGLSRVLDGDAARGVELIQQGVAKGGLKLPGEGRLQLGVAQALAGRTADAVQSFDALGQDATLGALAHAWSVIARAQAQPATAAAAPASAPAH